MNYLKVALLQIMPTGTIDGNREKGMGACPMEINRISQLRGRAYENMLGIATVNYPAEQPDCNGHSTAFDGIAYRRPSKYKRLISEEVDAPFVRKDARR